MARLIDPSISDLAAQQDGVVSADDIATAGLTAKQRRRRVESGWLTKVAPRVYRIAGVPSTHRQRLRIGLLSLGRDSWVSHEAAAALHGLDRSDPEAVEFTIVRGTSRARIPFTVHSTASVPRIDRVVVDGFRTMSATRTIIDLAQANHSQRRIEAAMDSAVRLGLSHPEAIARRLEALRGPGRAGCRTIDHLLPDAGGHSPLERRFLAIVRTAGVPRPRTQVVHRTADGRHVVRVDFLFDEHATVVEVTGRLGHVSDAERARDAQRRNELQDLGRTVIEYTSTTVNRNPRSVRDDLIRRFA